MCDEEIQKNCQEFDKIFIKFLQKKTINDNTYGTSITPVLMYHLCLAFMNSHFSLDDLQGCIENQWGKIKENQETMAKESKIKKVMSEFEHGKLHSGSKTGPMVKNKKQALAIAINESKKSK